MKQFFRNHQGLALIALAALVLFAFIMLGNDQLCIIHNVTGLPCPGCGMTRAYLALVRGDVAGAFYYHPLFWMIPFVAVVLIFQGVNKQLHKLYKSDWFWLALTIIFIGIYIVRLVLLFPGNEPMDFNENALFPIIFRLIFGA